MNITDLYAKSIQEYVAIAVRLGKDVMFYNYIRTMIKLRVYLIWEDSDVVYRWSSFICTAVGMTSLTRNAFLRESGRNVSLETLLHNQRDKFRENFMRYEKDVDEMVHPDRRDQLNVSCVGYIENRMVGNRLPCVFEGWYFDGGKHSIIRMAKIYSIQSRKKSTTTYQKLTRLGYIYVAYKYTSKLLSEHLNYQLWEYSLHCESYGFHVIYEKVDIEMLVNLGSLEYFLGNHDVAFRWCKLANDMMNSSLANACVGVTGTYLDSPETSLIALEFAWQNRFHFDKVSSYIFQVPLMSVMFNLLSSLNVFDRIDDCISLGSKILNISLFDPKGVRILLLSLLSWTTRNYHIVDVAQISPLYYAYFRGNDTISRNEVLRIQREYQTIINILFECCGKSENLRDYINEITNGIVDTVNIPRNEELMNPHDIKLRDYEPKKKITIITQYYEDRIYESDTGYALQSNLNNEEISSVVLLNEMHYDFSDFVNATKIVAVIIGIRYALSILKLILYNLFLTHTELKYRKTFTVQ